MAPIPIVFWLLQAAVRSPSDRGIYPELDAQAEVEAAGWRIRGGRVLLAENLYPRSMIDHGERGLQTGFKNPEIDCS
jgi:hypothetical protein